MARRSVPKIEKFDFPAGTILANRYEVEEKLGGGYEGEVYLVRERATGIERTAKVWFPQRNQGNRAARRYAKKLHKLRQCPILIQYGHIDTVLVDGIRIQCLVSEFVEGEIFSRFLARQPGRRLLPFQAMHFLHALVVGLQHIHLAGEYHGDIHEDNVIVSRYGLGFDLKLVDFYHWGPPTQENLREDIFDSIRLFYDALGGKKRYAKHPPEVKAICCGLKRSLIAQRFKRINHLRLHLETMEWS